MLHVKIGQLKNGLSSFLRKVRAGESVVIYDRDIPIARIEPMPAAPQKPKTNEEHFKSLIARGIALAPKIQDGDRSFLEGPLPKSKVSVLEALLEERREGR
jgi:antitoxin (DNA-binding transcriptional repressor) of toxin-antitoxin stability system